MISGFVDGIHGDEIVGWIANHGKARLLEPVILDGGSGEQMVFCPHYYRPDVAAAIGRAGIYGFAIPIGILPAGWMQIRLLTRFGDPLDQGELTLPNARHDITPAGLCHVFLHIQKTAGTSLRSALQNAIPASRQCLLYPSEPGLDLAQFNFLPFHQSLSAKTTFNYIAFSA
jgi:hypothetical protein